MGLGHMMIAFMVSIGSILVLTFTIDRFGLLVNTLIYVVIEGLIYGLISSLAFKTLLLYLIVVFVIGLCMVWIYNFMIKNDRTIYLVITAIIINIGLLYFRLWIMANIFNSVAV